MSKKSNISVAWEMALKAHRNQKWGNHPYTEHLLRVESLLEDYLNSHYDLNDPVRIAAILHDIVEDTDTTLEKIETWFGEEVEQLVWRLTDEAGANRKERKEATYPKIAENREAVLIKLCDRIVNIEYSLEVSSSKVDMYVKDYDNFRESLYNKSHDLDKVWAHLDQLISYCKGKTGVDFKAYY